MNLCNESDLIKGEGSAAGSRLRIWLVDDNKNFRELLAGILAAEEGFDCARQFPSAEAVVKALSIETPPDVILLDNHMGGMTGVEALRPIKLAAAGTRVVMLTSCCDTQTKRRAFLNGASDFLSKGCKSNEIADRIRRAPSTPLLPVVAPDREGVGLDARPGGIGGQGEAAFAGRFGKERVDKIVAPSKGSRRGASERFRCGLNRLRAALRGEWAGI